MGRARTHSDESILAAARDLMLEHGPRGVTTAAVSAASGAPTGSIYHRFGSRSALVAELWLRTVHDFHEFVHRRTLGLRGRDRALAVADAVLDYAVEREPDARLLTMSSREELRSDESLPAELRSAAVALNAPLIGLARELAGEIYGSGARPMVDRVIFAVYDIPYAAARHALGGRGRPSAALRRSMRAAVTAALQPAE
jgi:AcrR family transcriptional regulator